jgi:hypothetical protein
MTALSKLSHTQLKCLDHAHNHIQDDRRPARCGNAFGCSSAATSNCTLTGSSSRSAAGWRELQVGRLWPQARVHLPVGQSLLQSPQFQSRLLRLCEPVQGQRKHPQLSPTHTSAMNAHMMMLLVDTSVQEGAVEWSCTKVRCRELSVSQSEHALCNFDGMTHALTITGAQWPGPRALLLSASLLQSRLAPTSRL